MKTKQPVITNSKGEPIVLNAQEKMTADYYERQLNALGYEASITTLSTIVKKISEQTFYEIAPADYIPITVGQGAYSTNLLTFREFALADDFSTGVINTGSNDGRMASADVGIDSIPVKINNWGKKISWTILDLQFATRSGNWDIVAAKERARKKNWDLGIQKIAFLGLAGEPSTLGLYNQPGVAVNSSLITQPLSAMDAPTLSAFVAGMLNAYRANNGRTAWPTNFGIPESDYLGLATPSNPAYPLKSKLEVIKETLVTMTNNPNFKVFSLPYGDKIYSGSTYQVYVLYKYDETSLRMDIPVDYQSTLANSTDNFHFTNVGYGQFTGVVPYKPQELLYFQY